jgi:hypothetical protein
MKDIAFWFIAAMPFWIPVTLFVLAFATVFFEDCINWFDEVY